MVRCGAKCFCYCVLNGAVRGKMFLLLCVEWCGAGQNVFLLLCVEWCGAGQNVYSYCVLNGAVRSKIFIVIVC